MYIHAYIMADHLFSRVQLTFGKSCFPFSLRSKIDPKLTAAAVATGPIVTVLTMMQPAPL